jgi:hypothetical protein
MCLEGIGVMHAKQFLGEKQNSKIPEGRLVAGRRKKLVERRKFSW